MDSIRYATSSVAIFPFDFLIKGEPPIPPNEVSISFIPNSKALNKFTSPQTVCVMKVNRYFETRE